MASTHRADPIRCISVEGAMPRDVTLSKGLTILRVGGELRDGLTAALAAAGGRIVSEDDLPTPDPDHLATVVAHLEHTVQRQRRRRECLTTVDELSRRQRSLVEARDQLDQVALSGARLASTPTEDLARLRDDLSSLGLSAGAARLAGWITEIEEGRAQRLRAVTDLLSAIEDADRRWHEAGDGVVEHAPGVMAARAHRDELHGLAEELSAQIANGELAASARSQIEDAHASRVVAEEAGRRGGPLLEHAISLERQMLSRYGFSSYTEYLIATSTMSLGHHAAERLSALQLDLEAADAVVRRAVADAEATAADLLAERERLAEQRQTLEDRAGSAEIGELLDLSVVEDLIDLVDEELDSTATELAAQAAEFAVLGPELDVDDDEAAQLDRVQRDGYLPSDLERFRDAVAELIDPDELTVLVELGTWLGGPELGEVLLELSERSQIAVVTGRDDLLDVPGATSVRLRRPGRLRMLLRR